MATKSWPWAVWLQSRTTNYYIILLLATGESGFMAQSEIQGEPLHVKISAYSIF